MISVIFVQCSEMSLEYYLCKLNYGSMTIVLIKIQECVIHCRYLVECLLDKLVFVPFQFANMYNRILDIYGQISMMRFYKKVCSFFFFCASLP